MNDAQIEAILDAIRLSDTLTLNAEQSRVRSLDILLEELWMSVLSYNLECQFRREAAR